MNVQTPLGPEPTCPPPDSHPTTPSFILPPHACDAHFHVFGPGAKFPYAPERSFTPYDAPKEALFSLHRFLGFERGVFVQSSCHGHDHAALIDLLEAGEGRYRGVALLAPSTPGDEVERLDAAGVCGVRFHFMSHLGAPPPMDDVRAVIDLVEPFGWHIAMHIGGHGVIEQFGFIRDLEAPVVIDHMARIDIGEGLNGEAFTALLKLLDLGHVWVKLSGADRISKAGPPFRDAIPFARTIAAHAPERVVWGSDWPHPNVKHMPNDGALVDLITEITPDVKARRLMLVDNPTKLFGFS
jgi:predicted TIM-barrel fold metal-dependent hydrolase